MNIFFQRAEHGLTSHASSIALDQQFWEHYLYPYKKKVGKKQKEKKNSTRNWKLKEGLTVGLKNWESVDVAAHYTREQHTGTAP